jgi:uncharacterized protein YcbK (DUF882 family)
MKLSKYFSRHEFACKCGCGFNTVDIELLNLCDLIRDYVKKPVTASSGCRCIRHNASVGGASNSQHLYGRAADLIVDDPLAVYDYLDRRYPNRYGFGVYESWLHVDSRSNGPARWGDI